jgi:hypothetical protein
VEGPVPGLVREAPRGWGGVYSFAQRRQTPPPSPPLKGRGDLGNYRNICVISEIALYYDGSGQDLLRIFASLCEIILAQGFHLHERGVVRDRWCGTPHPQARRVQSPGLVREAPRGGGGVYSFAQRRQAPPPSPPLKGRGDLGNYCDICVISEIALYYDGTGQHLLLVFASLCEIILALGFHLHERGVVRDRWGVVYRFTQRRQAPPPSPPLKGRGDLGNYCDRCVISEIALHYDGSGQHLLRASAPLREILFAQRFDRA